MKVCDLDKFVSEKKTIILGGKEFDITIIPFEITLKMYELLPVMEKMEKGEFLSGDDYDKIMSIIYETLRFSDEKLTEKWVRKNINTARFNEIIPFIFSALFDDGKKNGENAEVDQATSTSDESSLSSVENTDGEPTMS